MAHTVDKPMSWYYRLSEESLAAIERQANTGPNAQPITSLSTSDEMVNATVQDLVPVRAALHSGRGFAIIAAGEPGDYGPRELTALFWLVGRLLGEPHEQNVQGTLLYDVRDTGQDVRYGARFSVTNAESTFHTDNSFGKEVVDTIGLGCLHPAMSGGLSQLVSGYSVQRELLARQPDAVDVLRQPFHIDRRGGVLPGEGPTVQSPIFAGDDDDLVVRYLRYWIEVGHEKAGVPLTAGQVDAMDALDRVAGDSNLRVEFGLRQGEMLFVNNRWMLHNRTAFEDYAEPQRRRHYLRLWLRSATAIRSPIGG
jgi:hypothetical protein